MSNKHHSESDGEHLENNNNTIQVNPTITVNPVFNIPPLMSSGGLLKEFRAITSLTPALNVGAGSTVTIGSIVVSINSPGNRVWLTAMIEVDNNLSNTVINYSIERAAPDGTVVCTIADVSSIKVTRNLTCVDPAPPVGEVEYLLRVNVEDGDATFTGNGTFTAAEIEANP
jgi:hypothetical protein